MLTPCQRSQQLHRDSFFVNIFAQVEFFFFLKKCRKSRDTVPLSLTTANHISVVEYWSCGGVKLWAFNTVYVHINSDVDKHSELSAFHKFWRSWPLSFRYMYKLWAFIRCLILPYRSQCKAQLFVVEEWLPEKSRKSDDHIVGHC